MYDLFYILEVRPNHYNLIVRDTHYCIAGFNDLEVIKRTIHKYVRKYKIEDRVYNTLSFMSDGGRVPPKVYEERKKAYLSGEHLVFEDLIKEVVAQALKENRQDTPYHHAKKRAVGVSLHTTVRTNPLTPTNEVRVVKKIVPRKITRTTTSGRTTE